MVIQASEQAYQLIKKHEGLRLETYQDSAGWYTIGYGHRHNASPGKTITESEAEMFLSWDVKDVESILNQYHLPLSQNQYDALVSWIFNLGHGNFKRSTLLKLVSQDVNDPNIRCEILKWNRAGGVILNGLIKRRQEEADLYFNNEYITENH